MFNSLPCFSSSVHCLDFGCSCCLLVVDSSFFLFLAEPFSSLVSSVTGLDFKRRLMLVLLFFESPSTRDPSIPSLNLYGSIILIFNSLLLSRHRCSCFVASITRLYLKRGLVLLNFRNTLLRYKILIISKCRAIILSDSASIILDVLFIEVLLVSWLKSPVMLTLSTKEFFLRCVILFEIVLTHSNNGEELCF